MSFVRTNVTTYTIFQCWVCGCRFAVDKYVHGERKRRGETLWCPAGCKLGLGEAESEKLRRKLERVEMVVANVRGQNEYLTRSNASLRGVVTRTKRRIASGKCPCCKQKFSDLASHMDSEHPDYL